jgi:hypothetical protein
MFANSLDPGQTNAYQVSMQSFCFVIGAVLAVEIQRETTALLKQSKNSE